VAPRTYGQACVIARALDVLGERWTLLVVRELLLGPKRFKDLLTALPAMGTNRLAARLKTLQAAGAVTKRRLPPPAGVDVYELTESGEQLRPAIYTLGAWGRQLPMSDVDVSDTARAELVAMGLAGASPPERSAGLAETYEFRVGEEQFHVNADHGVVIARSGPAPVEPDLLIECDLPTFFALATGALSPPQAAQSGRLRVTGDRGVLKRAVAVLGFGEAPRDMRLVPV
jgi:DNA-binding HxlR family transcriptional regulator/putative sterol carrier protein